MSHPPQPQPAQPRADLDYLSPQRLRLGGTGVFAGDWAADGTGRPIPAGFIGTLIDWWNGWAVWSCTRDVAHAVIADQQRAREEFRAARRAGGLTGTDLENAVTEAVPYLRFDGDEIILDDPNLEKVLRFAPDADGEYVICGWLWTWRAIDPAACDRIAGLIPADGSHQRWVQLQHTDMRVPHDRLRVTTLDELSRPNGVAFTATLTLDNLNVGTIENNGNGEQTWLRSPNNLFGGHRMTEYVNGCRLRGHAVTETQVLEALVNEYDIDRIARATTMSGGTLLQQRDSDGDTIDLVATGRLFPRNIGSARRAAAAYLTLHPGSTGAGWHLWTGIEWTNLGPITTPPPAVPPATTDTSTTSA